MKATKLGKGFLFIAVFVILIGVCAPVVIGESVIKYLGNFIPTGVSDDGRYVCGYALGPQAVRWLESMDTFYDLHDPDRGNLLPESCRSYSHAISPDGWVVVGEGFRWICQPDELFVHTTAFRWQYTGGKPSIDSLPDVYPTHGYSVNFSLAYGVSAYGSVIVGTCCSSDSAIQGGKGVGYEAIRWQYNNGSVTSTVLGDLPGGDFHSVATDVSADGSVVVGYGHASSGYEAFIWQGGGLEGLGSFSGRDSDTVAVSPDGSVVVWYSGSNAFRWQGGMIENIGNFKPYDVSTSGFAIVGTDDSGAVIWDEENGVRSLSEVLTTEFSTDLSDWELDTAIAMNPDASIIVGYGSYNGGSTAWRVILDVEDHLQWLDDIDADQFMTDSDRDGMLDTWEEDNFGDLSAGPDEDPDGDCRPNKQEYYLSSDPLEYDELDQVSPPTGVDASDNTYNDQVYVRWDPVSYGLACTTYYSVYRSETEGGTKTLVRSWQPDTHLYDTTVDCGQTYYYWIKAATDQSGSNASEYSDYDDGRPGCVHFDDPALKAAVEAELGVSNPTATDMLRLTELVSGDSNIEDLTGLRYARNLTFLGLVYGNKRDIDDLNYLTNLSTLILTDCQINDVDIFALSELWQANNLTRLWLYVNDISNIWPLRHLTKLTELSIYNNAISDIVPLSQLEALEKLSLSGNFVGSVTPLRYLPALRRVDLHDNHNLTDISAFRNMTNLEYLDVRFNPLDDNSCNVIIPEIETNNPGIELRHSCGP